MTQKTTQDFEQKWAKINAEILEENEVIKQYTAYLENEIRKKLIAENENTRNNTKRQ